MRFSDDRGSMARRTTAIGRIGLSGKKCVRIPWRGGEKVRDMAICQPLCGRKDGVGGATGAWGWGGHYGCTGGARHPREVRLRPGPAPSSAGSLRPPPCWIKFALGTLRHGKCNGEVSGSQRSPCSSESTRVLIISLLATATFYVPTIGAQAAQLGVSSSAANLLTAPAAGRMVRG